MSDRPVLSALASAFLAGEPTVEQLVERATRALGQQWAWLSPLAKRYIKAFSGGVRPRHREVVQFLLRDPGFHRARFKYRQQLAVSQWISQPQQMRPVEAARDWDLPVIESVGDLAAWFGVTVSELEWFADLKGFGYRKPTPKLQNYHYRILSKKSGKIRLIESPKSRLKQLQRQILTEILEKVPSHSAVHGFVKRCSIKTFVAPHVAQRVVLRMDLCDFFPSFRAARIQTFFRTLGYPEPVADFLGGICTNATPPDVWKSMPFDVNPADWRAARALYSRPHLPQGASTSPTIANLCSYRIDCRLAGLAKSSKATYTRYADDLGFSGGEDFERHGERF